MSLDIKFCSRSFHQAYQHKEHTIEKYEDKNEWCTFEEMLEAAQKYTPALRYLIGKASKGKNLTLAERSFWLGAFFAVLLSKLPPARSGFYCGLSVDNFEQAKRAVPPVMSSNLFKTSRTYGTKSVLLTQEVIWFVVSCVLSLYIILNTYPPGF